MDLATVFQVYSYGLPARPDDIERLCQIYPDIPAGYFEMVKEMTNLVLLWNRHGELRLWGPEQVVVMDQAYGVSAAIPGAMPYGDNGGGELLVHGVGPAGLATYLVDTGSLFLDEDAPLVAPDLQQLLHTAQGAELIFKSDQMSEKDIGPPRFEEGQYR
ncbi:hypothetical protein LB557_24205 [Mesorhizobium sp. BR115XR7A]|uniref:hypothetical protein n=1 Tax=unclassified Mesorhizobium TaxID=325217 RepID=UPI001CCAE6A2|nr:MULTISPECIES: hypothetical protein [unclassified Mesorhizobium]MBZ9724768.1 hypothetical protein [Mesorhizobium sp. CO1-1-11]MBZ9909118.1 hypothetical protein [Mesorhizobium sp. BR115XR7A]MBZ9932675.1 hypothetical protein [Mesorhizobium sp. BR1-1-5]